MVDLFVITSLYSICHCWWRSPLTALYSNCDTGLFACTVKISVIRLYFVLSCFISDKVSAQRVVTLVLNRICSYHW